MKRKKTRNQGRRARNNAAMVVAVALLWVLAAWMMLRVWAEHPAEQPVSGQAYAQALGGDVTHAG